MQIEEKNSEYKLRSFLLKLIIIIAIVTLLIWILPKFASYKKVNNATLDNSKNTSINDSKFKSNQLELKEAALKYYDKEKLPQNVGEKGKITLDDLKKQGLISELVCDNESCSGSESYVEITKLDNEYLLKVNLNCGKSSDYLIYHVGEYEYCTTLLCEANKNPEVEIDADSKVGSDSNNKPSVDTNKKQDSNNESNNSKKEDNSKNQEDNNTVIGEFGRWSNYEKTSCTTNAVTCDKNDRTCLQEIKIYKRVEKIDEKKITFNIAPPLLEKQSEKNGKLCSDYNYVEINNVLYYTNGDYSEVFLLNGSSTANWHYEGKISVSKSPAINIKKYYKFVGVDYSNCKEKCGSDIKYYYDVYTYNYDLNVASAQSCSVVSDKSYQTYTLKNKAITKTDSRPIYATVCYKSVRDRKLEKK